MREKRTIKERIADLINVKTIITVDVSVVFTVLALRGDIDPVATMSVVTMVMGFYFGTQRDKKMEDQDIQKRDK